MPELPEVETIRRGLTSLVGKKIVEVFRSEKKMRIESSLDLQGLNAATILEVTRRARYLIINCSAKNSKKISLILHLGMSGKVTHSLDFKGLKHDHFALKFDDNSWLIFNDARRFGFINLVETKNLNANSMLAKLGVEPLSDDFNSNHLAQKLRGKKMNIKTTMMDNEIVVGVGNIYINESLFESEISPLRNACDLSKKEIEKLLAAIKKIIAKAIELGGSSISDYVDSKGDFGSFQNSFRTYGREGQKCLRCAKSLIKRLKQNGRSTFFCASCQK